MIYEDVFYFPNASVKTARSFAKVVYEALVQTDFIYYVNEIALVPYKSGTRVLVDCNPQSHRVMLLCGLKYLEPKVSKNDDFKLGFLLGEKKYKVICSCENGIIMNKEIYEQYIKMIKLMDLFESKTDQERKETKFFNRASIDINSFSFDKFNLFECFDKCMDEMERIENETIPPFEKVVRKYDENQIHIADMTYSESIDYIENLIK